MAETKTTPPVQEFLLQALLQQNPEHQADVLARLEAIRHERIEKPILYIGAGTCGRAAGAAKLIPQIEAYLKDHGLEAEIIEVGCIGFCAIEPLLDVQLPGKARVSFSQVAPHRLETILNGVFSNNIQKEYVLGQFRHPHLELYDGVPFIEDHPFFARQQRVVLADCGIINPASIEEYIARGGYQAYAKVIRMYTSTKVCEIVSQSGLRGRGGGGYPTGQKWKIAHDTPSDQKYLICNADESDPGAFMDRAVMEGDPHRIIEGMAIAAYAIGVRKAYIYIREEYTLAIERLEKALQQAKTYGLLGEHILKSGVNLEIIVRKGAGAFVCGEETALIRSIEGQRAMPSPKPPYPAIKGLFGKPTVVNNLETLANIPSIFKQGPNWFQSIGTETSKGTKVFALTGKIENAGLIEVPMGTSLREIVFETGGGSSNNRAFKAIQIGGPSGSCLSADDLDLHIDYNELNSKGHIMGSGGLVVMDENTCMVDMARFFIEFLHKESCGKCIPCREGTGRMLDILNSITMRPTNESSHETLKRFKGVMQLESLAEVIRDTSLCGLGQTAPNPVLSTLQLFREEYEEHIFDRKCRAGVCKELRTFYIEVDKCTGCTACAKKCPSNAIIGTPRQPHFIVQDKCIGCGICFDTCKFVAVTVK